METQAFMVNYGGQEVLVIHDYSSPVFQRYVSFYPMKCLAAVCAVKLLSS